MKMEMKKETIILNAIITGNQAQAAAFASTLCGMPAESVCCWCAEKREGEFFRLPRGGECSQCAITGRDVGVLFRPERG